jgi:D-glycero-alpha-D-manno-heptose-7-phosphate kinase
MGGKLIISRTPFRISFFGGGTDYPVWYEKHGGAVLATTINKYCYLTCRYMPQFFDFKTRVAWSKIEHVKDRSEIEHPGVREILGFLNIDVGVNIHHDGDLPARAGLGSSSSFAVGLLNALYALQGVMPSQRQLAAEATHIEQVRLGENVGCQDQVLAAYGGFNRIDFGGSEAFTVRPIVMPRERLQLFKDHLMLFFTGLSRNASEIAAAQVESVDRNSSQLTQMHQLVDEAANVLTGTGDLAEFGRLLDVSWQLKRSLTDSISNSLIDDAYSAALDAGAIGGKLLGAGGGGFMAFFVRPDEQQRVREALQDLLYVPFDFEQAGSQIIFYDPVSEYGNEEFASPRYAPSYQGTNAD